MNDNADNAALPSFHVMAKPAGARCNLKCSYCFYSPKIDLYPGSALRMEEPVLREYIRQLIAAHSTEVVEFAWQGGEPTLLGVDFFKKAVELQKQYCPPGKTIRNSFQTNGILLDELWCRFLKENNFLVGISVDGPAGLHDRYRVDKSGAETHTRVTENVHLLKKMGVEFNILCCVSKQNVERPEIVYRFFRNVLGVEFIQFVPIVNSAGPSSTGTPCSFTEFSVTGAEYGEFLVRVFDEWIKKDVGRIFVQIFDAALSAWYGGPPAVCVFAKTCGMAMALEHNGDLYSCDHFVDPEHLLGNIMNTDMAMLAVSPKQKKFGADKFDTLPRVCRECRWLFICNGECPKNRLSLTDDGEPGLNSLCEGFKRFFSYVDEPMKFMVGQLNNRKPPAAVMEWYARRRKKR